jgi:hypothetical protein
MNDWREHSHWVVSQEEVGASTPRDFVADEHEPQEANRIALNKGIGGPDESPLTPLGDRGRARSRRSFGLAGDARFGGKGPSRQRATQPQTFGQTPVSSTVFVNPVSGLSKGCVDWWPANA